MLKISHVEILKPDDFQPEFEPAFPLERVWLIYSLDDDPEYAPSEIAKLGYPPKTQEYLRTRRAFARLGARNGLQDNFDNLNKKTGEYNRWAGSSWKEVLGAGYQSRIYLLMEELQKRLEEDPGPYFLDSNTLLHARDIKPPKQVKPRKPRTKRSASKKSALDVPQAAPLQINSGPDFQESLDDVEASINQGPQSDPDPLIEGNPQTTSEVAEASTPQESLSFEIDLITKNAEANATPNSAQVNDEQVCRDEQQPQRNPYLWLTIPIAMAVGFVLYFALRAPEPPNENKTKDQIHVANGAAFKPKYNSER